MSRRKRKANSARTVKIIILFGKTLKTLQACFWFLNINAKKLNRNLKDYFLKVE